MAERLLHAGMNTLVGLAVVFSVLILIAWIISLFKYTVYLEKFLADRKAKKAEKKRKKQEAKNGVKTISEESVDKTIEQIVQKEELSNDLELVAVIMAAIHAATGQSLDSFVVRSIKKVGRKG